MDALTDILQSVHLSGSVYCRSELTAPWGMSIPGGENAQFHVVRRGRCFLLLDPKLEREPERLEAGDVLLLPRGHAHTLADDPRSPVRPLHELMACHLEATRPAIKPAPLTHGGGGEPTTLVCGYFSFDSLDNFDGAAAAAAHPLLTVLPPVVLVRGEAGRARSWLESTLDLIAHETTAGRPGGETLINRLTEALFIQVLRAHLDRQERPPPSWLAGLRDPQIARALGLVHRAPQARWTLEELAARAGMSRSTFSARFRELVGEPPLTYLTRWRMQVAANHLREQRLSLSEIAETVGYGAEASFSKVFKRLWGVAPATYRRRHAAPPQPLSRPA